MKIRVALITVIMTAILQLPIPALAISNPSDINFTSDNGTQNYKVFENVAHTGDMLFVAEGFVYYPSEPTDYTASEAFIFEILNTAGNVTLLSTPLNDYGDRPISIYQTASQVTSANLTSGTSYIMRIRGNPLVFPSMSGNSVNVTLTTGDYIDQSIGADSEKPTDNNLRNFLIMIGQEIEDYDQPPINYLITAQGYRYLSPNKNSEKTIATETTSIYSGSSNVSTTINTYTEAAYSGLSGSDIFLEGIPNLMTLCPILFQYGTETMDSDAPESTGAYAATITPVQKWGQLTADGLTNIGVFLGVNQALAGSVVLFIGCIALAVYAYRKTESGITVLLLVSSAPLIGGFLGLMPMALAFIFVIVIMILMGYYFFSRGAL